MSGRIRTIKPEWREDEKLSHASDAARVLSVALITLADDYGNGRADVGRLQGEVWPVSGGSHEDFRRKHKKTTDALAELVEMGFVTLYRSGGQHYFSIRNWSKHQRVQHPGKPQVPEPTETLMSVSGESHESLTPDQRPTTNDQRPTTNEGDLHAMEVFDYWADKLWSLVSSRRVKPTESRKRHIRARLADGYSVSDLQQVIDAVAKSQFHLGANSEGKPYVDFKTIMCSAEKVDGWLAKRDPVLRTNGNHSSWNAAVAGLAEAQGNERKLPQ